MASIAIAPRWIVRLTGAKGWFELTGTSQISTIVSNSFTEPAGDVEEEHDKRTLPAKGKQSPQRLAKARKPAALRILQITISLGPDDPPIVPLDPKLHGADHAPGLPVVEVTFDFTDDDSSRAFAVLRDVRADRVTLRTTASGLKNLMVIAGGGMADVAKPFAPFGPQPKAGAFFTIGSSEIFSKPIAHWKLNVDWQSGYSPTGFFWNDDADLYNAAEAVLTEGRWVAVGGSGTLSGRFDAFGRWTALARSMTFAGCPSPKRSISRSVRRMPPSS